MQLGDDDLDKTWVYFWGDFLSPFKIQTRLSKFKKQHTVEVNNQRERGNDKCTRAA